MDKGRGISYIFPSLYIRMEINLETLLEFILIERLGLKDILGKESALVKDLNGVIL